MSHGIVRRTAAIAVAAPAQLVALAASGLGAHGHAKRIRGWLGEVSVLACILTTAVWVLVLWRGILYPAFGGAHNLAGSWGGPTLAGAWAVHLGITLSALLGVSLALALPQGRSAMKRSTGSGVIS